MIQRRFGCRNANSTRSGVVSLIERRFAVFYLYKKYFKNIFLKNQQQKNRKKSKIFFAKISERSRKFREIFRAVMKIRWAAVLAEDLQPEVPRNRQTQRKR